jgi:SAM-dependent methyltransferase
VIKSFAVYERLKRILLRVVPDKFLRKTEFNLRYLFSIFYRGSGVHCSVCDGHFTRFIHLSSGDQLCPRCGSLPRQRRLWILLQQNGWLENENRILHFSPSRIIQKKLQSLNPSHYTASDYSPEANTAEHFDITDIARPPGSYDIIICYHVLEHIPDDAKAILELFRITRKDGIVLIQTPFREGAIYENSTIVEPAERKLHFGQEDHVRIYSVAGLKERLEKAGFYVGSTVYAADPYLGLKDETILWCKKN